MKKIMIVGATSTIALATARLFAARGDDLFLVARDLEKLDAVAQDLKTRGTGRVENFVMDFLEYDRHEKLIEEAESRLGSLDTVLIAYGTLPDQEKCQQSIETTRKELEVNCLSLISLLTYLANYFERKKCGAIAVISSVAGDRGRQSNYIYGTAKGAVSLFLQGLRNRLDKAGVHVLTIKPGFVDTPMTEKFKKGPLWAQPEKVAKDIDRALRKKIDVVYVPRFWKWIMIIIKMIPERFFKKLGL